MTNFSRITNNKTRIVGLFAYPHGCQILQSIVSMCISVKVIFLKFMNVNDIIYVVNVFFLPLYYRLIMIQENKNKNIRRMTTLLVDDGGGEQELFLSNQATLFIRMRDDMAGCQTAFNWLGIKAEKFKVYRTYLFFLNSDKLSIIILIGCAKLLGYTVQRSICIL